MSAVLAGGFLTTVPPGKSPQQMFLGVAFSGASVRMPLEAEAEGSERQGVGDTEPQRPVARDRDREGVRGQGQDVGERGTEEEPGGQRGKRRQEEGQRMRHWWRGMGGRGD